MPAPTPPPFPLPGAPFAPPADKLEPTSPGGPRREPSAGEASSEHSAGRAGAVRALLNPAQEGAAPRYVLGPLLGKGGMAEVLSVYDTRLRRTVAMKLLRPENREEEDVVRFLHEGQVTGQLEHPNIVPVYDIGIGGDGRVFFTMKRLQGESLGKRIQAKTGAPSLVQRLQWFVQLCDAVSYAHSRGVVHRDLKPANIMIGDFGQLLVLDWGIAKQAGEAPVARPVTHAEGDGLSAEPTRADSVIGTPSWMAPEQALGSTADFLSDQYALGAILYLMLTGRPPFTPGAAVLTAVEAGAFEPPRRVSSGVSRELEAVCLRAMSLLPQHRFATVADLRQDVQAWLEGRPVRAMAYPWWLRLKRFAVQRRELFAVAGGVGALALLVVVAATVVYVVGIRRAQNEATRRLADGLVTLAIVHAEDGSGDRARVELGEARALYTHLDEAPPLAVLFARSYLAYRVPEPLLSFTGVAADVSGLLSEDEDRIVLIDADRARIFDTLTGVLICERQITTEPLRWGDSAFLPGGDVRLAWYTSLESPATPPTGAADVGAVGPPSLPRRLLHVADLSPAGELTELWTREQGPRVDGDWVYLRSGGSVLLLASADGVQRLHADDGSPAGPLLSDLWMLDASPDGGLALGRSRETGPILTRASDHGIWDLQTGERLWTQGVGDEGWAFSPDSTTLAILYEHALHLVDVRTGQPLWAAPAQDFLRVNWTTGAEDALWLHSRSGIAQIDRMDGHILTRSRFSPPGAGGDFYSISPRGRWVSTVRPGVVGLTPLESATNSKQFGTSEEALASLALSPDGLLFATSGVVDGNVRIRDRASGALLRTIQSNVQPVPANGTREAVFDASGRVIATADRDGRVRRWDIVTGERLSEYFPDLGLTVGVAVSEGLVAATFQRGSIVIWDAATGAELHRLSGAVTHGWSLAFSPDGTRLAVSGRGANDPRWELWDPRSGARLGACPEVGVSYRLSWSPDGERLFVPAHSGPSSIWTVSEPFTATPLASGPSPDLSAKASRDGRLLAIAGGDGVALWDLAGPTHLGNLALFPDLEATDLAFSRDGTSLIVGNGSGAVVSFTLAPIPGVERAVDSSTPLGDDAVLQAGRGAAAAQAFSHAERLYDEWTRRTGLQAPPVELGPVYFATGSRARLEALRPALLAAGVAPATLDLWSAQPAR